MPLGLDEVRTIARLARLEFDEEGLERMRSELENILDWMARLDEVDTEGVEPLAHVHDVSCPMRDDVVTPSLGGERAVAVAPAHDGTAFEVPKVIGEG